MRALYLGRFNPPHLGHIEAIKYILEQSDVDEIIILIGSGEKAYYIDNPFTGGERVEMLTAMVKQHFDLNQFYIMAIPDANRNSIWPAHLIDLVPPFDIIFSNNPIVQELFMDLTNKEVREIPLVNRKEYSGTKIREKIKNKEKWENLVPQEVVELIKKYNGPERIRRISKSDKAEKSKVTK